MIRIIKIGMDVHTTNYTLCAVEPRIDSDDITLGTAQVEPELKNIQRFIENLKKKIGEDCDITCGYEAGCLGYTLYHELTKIGIKCVILAPSTMLSALGKRIKTDSRDALMIATCLCHGTYSAVHIPTPKDDAVRSYLRMREDHLTMLKKLKQQINAFCLVKGFRYEKRKWTGVHIQWLKTLALGTMDSETLQEYLLTYQYLSEKVERLDRRIEELAYEKEYAENVKRLECLLGIKVHTALSCLVETGDFTRFAKGSTYAAYLGLAPGEYSSGDHINRTGITKAGNSHVRKLLIEAAESICKGRVGYKSKDLKHRQQGNTPEVIAYADKASERLRRKYYRMISRGKARNVAVAAVARELACFVWGMVTNHIGMVGQAGIPGAAVSQG